MAVVLPAPLGPSSTVTVPGGTLRLSPSRAITVGPKVRRTPASSTTASGDIGVEATGHRSSTVTAVDVMVNGEDMTVGDGASVGDLIEQLGLGARWVLVERNGEPVPRAELATTSLCPGDRLELVRAVAGG